MKPVCTAFLPLFALLVVAVPAVTNAHAQTPNQDWHLARSSQDGPFTLFSPYPRGPIAAPLPMSPGLDATGAEHIAWLHRYSRAERHTMHRLVRDEKESSDFRADSALAINPSDDLASRLLPPRAPSEQPTKPTADQKFWLLTSMSLALTVADIELTQHCIHRGVCREGNPLIPSARAKVYPMQLGLTVGYAYLAYRFRKRGVKTWWAPQIALSAGHSIGIAFGLRFVGSR